MEKNKTEKDDFVQLDIVDSNSDDSDSEIPEGPCSQTSSVSTLETEPILAENPKWLGNCRALCYIGCNPLFTIGPHWPFYLGMNAFVITLSCLFLVSVISKVTFIGTVVGVCLLLAQVLAYFLTSFLNPGIPDRALSRPGAAQKLDKK